MFCGENLKFEEVEDNIKIDLNLLNAELNPICHLLALSGLRYIIHVSRIKVKEENI
jgi:hypothetical protein